MNWDFLANELNTLYANNKASNNFLKDELYLRRAFFEIENYWLTQYNKIKNIKYVMISEAPLWGDNDAYFYNPNYSGNHSYFSNNDLYQILKKNTTTRQQLIDELNEIGFLILDVFPFAFKKEKTDYHYDKNYHTLKQSKYYNTFLNAILNHYLSDKLDLIIGKKADPIKLFYRYEKISPIKPNIESLLIQKGLIVKNQLPLPSIHGNSYNIDKKKLSYIIP
jgi:hypothetical protein